MGLKIDWVYQAYSEQLPPEDTEFIGFPIMYNLFVVSVLYSNCFCCYWSVGWFRTYKLKALMRLQVKHQQQNTRSIFFLVILFIERTSILVKDNGRSIKTNEFHKSTFGLHSHHPMHLLRAM